MPVKRKRIDPIEILLYKIHQKFYSNSGWRMEFYGDLTQFCFCCSTNFLVLVERQFWWKVFLHLLHFNWSLPPEQLQTWHSEHLPHSQSEATSVGAESLKRIIRSCKEVLNFQRQISRKKPVLKYFYIKQILLCIKISQSMTPIKVSKILGLAGHLKKRQ